MVSALFFSQLMLVALVWLCVMLHWAWPSDTATYPTALEPLPPLPKRTREPKPFVGLTHKPHCDAWGSRTITVDRRIAPPTAAPERGVKLSLHPAPQCPETLSRLPTGR